MAKILLTILLLTADVRAAEPNLGGLSLVTDPVTGKCALRYHGLGEYRFFVVERASATRARASVVEGLRSKIRDATETEVGDYEAILKRIEQYRWYCAGVYRKGVPSMFCTAVDPMFWQEGSNPSKPTKDRSASYYRCEDDIHTRKAEAALPLPAGGITALSVWFRLRKPKMEELEISPKGLGDR